MKRWPSHPLVYEINTWVWLRDLGQKYRRPLTLANVPEAEWEAIAALGVDAVWLMGVWERSPAGIKIAMRNRGLVEDFKRALPDFAAQDNVGSPYCVRRYVVDEHLGGPAGLAAARRQLRLRNVRLIADFVPNHVAPDHPWVETHPEYFIRGSADDARGEPASFVETAGAVFACGRDPFFPAWPDVLQLNALAPGLRQAALETVDEIAAQCDGVRCDMAMLMLNTVFARTWGARAGAVPVGDYWQRLIPAIKKTHHDFKFIAEAYWDLEWELVQQGFDYCYDKKLYDRLEHGDAEGVRRHLLADSSYQAKMLRFIENHDEARAAAAFAPRKARAAALAVLTLPGAKLVHEGQFAGRKVRLPVFLGRRPDEPADDELAAFYARLLSAVNRPALRAGQWSQCTPGGWPDNQSYQGILAWCWSLRDERYLVVINYQAQAAQARIVVPWDDLREKTWRLSDLLSDDVYDRDGSELRDVGLYVDLAPWRHHLFALRAG